MAAEMTDVEAFARFQFRSHVPREDTYGATCDEQGCAVCNIGAEDEYVSYYTDLADRTYLAPDDDEVADARAWLAEDA